MKTVSEEAIPGKCGYLEKFLLANSKQGFFIGDKVRKQQTFDQKHNLQLQDLKNLRFLNEIRTHASTIALLTEQLSHLGATIRDKSIETFLVNRTLSNRYPYF